MKVLIGIVLFVVLHSGLWAEDWRSFEFSVVRTFHQPVKMALPLRRIK